MARALGKVGGKQLRSQSCYTDKFCLKWRSHWASDRVDDGPRSPRVERSSAMPTYFLTHHFPKDFQGSPETASAATAWFASMGVNLVGRGGNPTVQPQRLGNCGSEQAHLA